MYKVRRNVYRRQHRIEEGINRFLCFVILFGILPIFITTFFQRLEMEDLIFNKSSGAASEIEIKLPEIVAKQISIHMPEEVIKAQAVIARTNLMAAEEKGEAMPVGFTMEELQNLWGEQFDSYYEKMQSLIAETAGQTLQYNNTYIYAPYHQASAGNTRSMAEYYTSSAMPYLTSVACHEDTTSEGYLNVYFWTKEEFLALCENYFPEESIASGEDIKILSRDSAGYVLEVQVGQTNYEGEIFRKTLNLPSACFEITLIDEDVRIVTMGQGHGFGLSQYMAGQLAQDGKTYEEILQYFYKGATIVE